MLKKIKKSIENHFIEITEIACKESENEEAFKRGYFNHISKMDTYFMEDRITYEMQKHYCERKAFSQLDYFPNLDNPKSLNEKIIWLALNYKNINIAKYSDKAEFKREVGAIIGKEYLVPTIGVYEDVNDIDFKSLPGRFVVKSTGGWGSKQVYVIDKNKKYNWDRIKANMASWLYPWNIYYYQNMCITDGKIKPRILVEESIVEADKLPVDCKIYCCNGEPEFALVVDDRDTKYQTRTFMDLKTWTPLPFKRNKMKTAENVEKPDYIDEMVEISRKLAKELPFARVDFYICDNKFYVGELTFYPGMFLKINPVEWDFKLGEWIDLSNFIAE